MLTGKGMVDTPNEPTEENDVNGIVEGTAPDQPITFDGWVKGSGYLDNVRIAGTHDPGASPILLSVGNLEYASGSNLNLEIGGTSRGTQYDAIEASGLLTLSGTLHVSLIDSFSPSIGDTFHILDWATIAGHFSSLQLPNLDGGRAWNLSQLYTQGVLSIASPPGDYNHDGVVDAADYTVWRDSLGSTSNLAADGNVNGTIDLGDYDVWKSNFGKHGGSSARAAVTAPEPASATILFVGIVAFCSCRRFLAS
jgi:hypothetical protein